jgi:NitT/TauT family transport system ATP-binding protein
MRLRIEDVSMRFVARDGYVDALDSVSLDVEPRQFMTLVGPSGCGKSTLLKVAAGLLKPSSGRVLLGDDIVTEPRTDIGMMFQSPVLLPWKSVLGNVMLQAEVRGLDRARYEKRSRELLTQVGLGGNENNYVFELSGGMQQRASFCRAVLHEPGILLMDEPFGALDALTREQVAFDLQKMRLAAGGQTVLFVTHSISEAVLLSDRVAVFSKGPGRILDMVDIPLERPRDKGTMTSVAFGELAAKIRSVIDSSGNGSLTPAAQMQTGNGAGNQDR